MKKQKLPKNVGDKDKFQDLRSEMNYDDTGDEKMNDNDDVKSSDTKNTNVHPVNANVQNLRNKITDSLQTNRGAIVQTGNNLTLMEHKVTSKVNDKDRMNIGRKLLAEKAMEGKNLFHCGLHCFHLQNTLRYCKHL